MFRTVRKWPIERIEEIAGTTYFPSAKNASEPYLHLKSHAPPVKNGTPISVWWKNPNPTPSGSRGWWVAQSSNPKNWAIDCVWRLRNVTPTKNDATLARIATALERIATALERAK